MAVTPGRDFVRWLRPAGAALFLILSILTVIVCFTAKGTPVKGYKAPQTSEYYAQHPDELAAELTENLFPKLGKKAAAAVSDGKVAVTAPAEDLQAVKYAVIHYYDESLFSFEPES